MLVGRAKDTVIHNTEVLAVLPAVREYCLSAYHYVYYLPLPSDRRQQGTLTGIRQPRQVSNVVQNYGAIQFKFAIFLKFYATVYLHRVSPASPFSMCSNLQREHLFIIAECNRNR